MGRVRDELIVVVAVVVCWWKTIHKIYNKNTFNWSSVGNYDDDRTNNQCTSQKKIKNKTIITESKDRGRKGGIF